MSRDTPPNASEADGRVNAAGDRRHRVDTGADHRREPVLDESPDHPVMSVGQRQDSASSAKSTTPLPAKPPDSGSRAMAIFSYLSLLFGLPVFLLPLFQRHDAFALHHAKAAGLNYTIFVLLGAAALTGHGLALGLALLCYVPALVGLVRASHGRRAGRWGLGEAGEYVFSAVEVNDDSR